MKKIVLTLLLFPFLLFSQEKGTFMIEAQANYTKNHFSEINDLINNRNFVGSEHYDPAYLKNGMSYGLNVSYVVLPLLNIGFYGEFQNNSITQKMYNEFEDFLGNKQIDIIQSNYNIQSYNLGISTDFILNNFSFWKDKSWLSRIDSKISIQMGYGKSFFNVSSKTIDSEYSIENNIEIDDGGRELFNAVYASDGFQFIASLKIGYILSKNHYFSSIGIKMGYQYFISSSLRIGRKNTPSYFNDLNTKLDFSGLNAGIYLTFGR
jgi:hypothetical protein